MIFSKRKVLSYREKLEFIVVQNYMGKEDLLDGNEIMEVWMGKYYMLRKFQQRGRGLDNRGNNVKMI